MKSYLVVAIVIANAVNAQWAEDMKAVQSAADALAEKVEGWSQDQGLQGALQIQGNYPTLSDAVQSLSKDAVSVQASDVDVQSTLDFVSSVVTLLKDLTEKASDFSGVGAGQIVSNDLKEIGQPAADIVSNLIKAGTEQDCAKVNSLVDADALNNLGGAFSSAFSAYSMKPVEFPSNPSCDASGGESGGSAGSSGSASNTGGASASPTDSPSASKPSGGGGAGNAGSSGGGSSGGSSGDSSGGNSGGSSGGSSSSTGVSMSNTGNRAVAELAVLAGAGAAIIALLI